MSVEKSASATKVAAGVVGGAAAAVAGSKLVQKVVGEAGKALGADPEQPNRALQTLTNLRLRGRALRLLPGRDQLPADPAQARRGRELTPSRRSRRRSKVDDMNATKAQPGGAPLTVVGMKARRSRRLRWLALVPVALAVAGSAAAAPAGAAMIVGPRDSIQ